MDFLAEQNSESSEPDEHGYLLVDYEHMSIAQHATSESSESDVHGSSRADYERVGVEHVSTHYDYSSESDVDVQTLRIACNSKAARRQRADHKLAARRPENGEGRKAGYDTSPTTAPDARGDPQPPSQSFEPSAS